jgi:hypothetical protein
VRIRAKQRWQLLELDVTFCRAPVSWGLASGLDHRSRAIGMTFAIPFYWVCHVGARRVSYQRSSPEPPAPNETVSSTSGPENTLPGTDLERKLQ